jgi:hypothetical protein
MTGFSELPVELLDAILQHINIKTLLFAQLVSRTWHNAIASSPQLQEDLFFRPKIPKHPNYTCVWTKEKLDYFGPPRDITNTNPGFTSKTTSQTYTPIESTASSWTQSASRPSTSDPATSAASASTSPA